MNVAKLYDHVSNGSLVLQRLLYRHLNRDSGQNADSPLSEIADTSQLLTVGRYIALGFVFVFIGWASLVPLDSAVVAPGVITTEGNRKAIQHLEGGIVESISVSDGNTVKQGQKLIKLEQAAALAAAHELQNEHESLVAAETRLIAERDSKRSLTSDELLINVAGRTGQQAVLGELRQFDTRRRAFDQQLAIINQQRSQEVRATQALEAQQKAAQDREKLLLREVESVSALFDKDLVTLPRLLNAQRDLATAQGEIASLEQRIAQGKLRIEELSLQSSDSGFKRDVEIASTLRDVQTKRISAGEQLNAARDRLDRTVIRAPVSGKVISLAVHSRGAVIKPGETFLEIVPDHEPLRFKVRVRPQDVDSLIVGMQASINMTSYDKLFFPAIKGTVEIISADSLQDAASGTDYFSVIVSARDRELQGHKDVLLLPGLPVEVAIKTGQRTFLDYLLRPISDVIRQGMREK